MSREGFITVLDRVGSFDSPALWGNYPRMELREIAGDVYDGIVDEGGDPAVELAVCGREHTFGTNQGSVLWRSYRAGQPTYAWGNQRTVRHPGIQSAGTWHDPERNSTYARFRDVRDSARDAVYRVKDPTFAYANATSIRDVLHIWAPSSDNNNPDSFAQYVVDRVNEWSAEFPVEQETPVRQLKIALAAGHRNTDGGNAIERELVAEHCFHAVQQFRAAGADVRCITPNDGRGIHPGGLQAVAQQVVNWHNQGWQADLFLEFHTEGTASHIRGAFAIYPDWGNDVDVDVRDTLGPDMAQRVAQAMGIPIRGNGTMSERNTGVGGQGHRLGVFLRTAPIRQTCTRMLLESGAHSNASDLAILRRPETPGRIAKSVVESVYAFYGVPLPGDEPKPDPNAKHFKQTDHWIINTITEDGRIAILDYWTERGGVGTCGYPISGMTKDADGVYRQLFENVLIEAWPDHLHNGVGILHRFGGLGRRYRDATIDVATLQAEIEGNPECDCS